VARKTRALRSIPPTDGFIFGNKKTFPRFSLSLSLSCISRSVKSVSNGESHYRQASLAVSPRENWPARRRGWEILPIRCDTVEYSAKLCAVSLPPVCTYVCAHRALCEFQTCHARRLHNSSSPCRLFLRRVQQLGQASRWHFHVARFSQTVPSQHRLPSLHVRWSARRNRGPNVSSVQHSS